MCARYAGLRLPFFSSPAGRPWKAFEPYDSIKEENPPVRTAGRALIAEGKTAGPKRRSFLFVNTDRGNAISTITAVVRGYGCGLRQSLCDKKRLNNLR